MCPPEALTPTSPACSKHASKFTDFNLWGRALTKAEMEEWTACRTEGIKYGDVVDWRTAEWELINTTRCRHHFSSLWVDI